MAAGRALLLAMLAAILAGGAACGPNPCLYNQRQLDVRPSGGYVCEPIDDGPSPVAPVATKKNEATDGGAPDTTTTTTTTADGCAVVDPGVADVVVESKSGAASIVADRKAPDGTYQLVQASVYPGDGGGAPPVWKLRAQITIAGVKLSMGAQEVLWPRESITLFLGAGVLGTLCETHAGPVASWLFAGAAGATEEAHVSWAADSLRVRIVIPRPTGDVELLFAPTT